VNLYLRFVYCSFSSANVAAVRDAMIKNSIGTIDSFKFSSLSQPKSPQDL
jgi:hypothetical protein